MHIAVTYLTSDIIPIKEIFFLVQMSGIQIIKNISDNKVFFMCIGSCLINIHFINIKSDKNIFIP
ncbi:hypothetical protein VY86_00305 [Photorhabdus thracensis]|uniref:Uncharacterized protein n=1 Tax=Photorhabdus thracensis TaxID=230089 RepID=A0A0F7LJQ6_9GAMM|nr:hypothetical protein VY86_00305 [Photorhabdus thracensis]